MLVTWKPRARAALQTAEPVCVLLAESSDGKARAYTDETVPAHHEYLLQQRLHLGRSAEYLNDAESDGMLLTSLTSKLRE